MQRLVAEVSATVCRRRAEPTSSFSDAPRKLRNGRYPKPTFKVCDELKPFEICPQSIDFKAVCVG
jgi:hypothetical protein